jgi:hypothetical protein
MTAPDRKAKSVKTRNTSDLNVPIKDYQNSQDHPQRQIGLNSTTGRNDFERENG